MKRIVLTTAEALRTKGAPAEMFSDLELARRALNTPLETGFTTDEIRKRARVLDKLDAVEGKFKIEGRANLDLEDAEHETLQIAVKGARWGFVESTIIKFEDAVLTARTVDPSAELPKNIRVKPISDSVTE